MSLLFNLKSRLYRGWPFRLNCRQLRCETGVCGRTAKPQRVFCLTGSTRRRRRRSQEEAERLVNNTTAPTSADFPLVNASTESAPVNAIGQRDYCHHSHPRLEVDSVRQKTNSQAGRPFMTFDIADAQASSSAMESSGDMERWAPSLLSFAPLPSTSEENANIRALRRREGHKSEGQEETSVVTPWEGRRSSHIFWKSTRSPPSRLALSSQSDATTQTTAQFLEKRRQTLPSCASSRQVAGDKGEGLEGVSSRSAGLLVGGGRRRSRRMIVQSLDTSQSMLGNMLTASHRKLKAGLTFFVNCFSPIFPFFALMRSLCSLVLSPQDSCDVTECLMTASAVRYSPVTGSTVRRPCRLSTAREGCSRGTESRSAVPLLPALENGEQIQSPLRRTGTGALSARELRDKQREEQRFHLLHLFGHPLLKRLEVAFHSGVEMHCRLISSLISTLLSPLLTLLLFSSVSCQPEKQQGSAIAASLSSFLPKVVLRFC